jgi:mRNA deadenylase 3'-5' endonuclease subunit Ccr4
MPTHHTSLIVASLNLLNDLTHWDDRRSLIVAELRRLQPDLIALQEVVLPVNNAQWIADELGGYSAWL